LTFSKEKMTMNKIQFLDLLLIRKKGGLCWRYQQRKSKPILHYTSNHSKIVKKGIVISLLRNTRTKSCKHESRYSKEIQLGRLEEAQYPSGLIEIEDRKLVKEWAMGGKRIRKEREKLPVAIIPFYHTFSHHFLKEGRRLGVQVAFNHPEKNERIARRTTKENTKCEKAISTHTQYRACSIGRVYRIPLTCGRWYTGQTKKCVNHRLTQHSRDMNTKIKEGKQLKQHKEECKCDIIFEETKVSQYYGSQIIREVLEAYHMKKWVNKEVGEPSIIISKIEMEMLEKESKGNSWIDL
jgi:hypothetical protein